MSSLASIVEKGLQTSGTRPAIIFGAREYDWGWVRARADEVQQALLEIGIGPDAPVGLCARNRPVFAAALLSLLRDARSIVMIYAFQSPEAIAADITKLKLAAVVADRQDWTEATIVAAKQAGTAAIVLDNDAANPVGKLPGLERVGAEPHRGPFPVPGIESLTSGTTGAPKRFLMSFDLIRRSMVGESVTSAELQGKDAVPSLMFYPLGNISGLYAFLPRAVAGHRFVLAEKFSLDLWHELVKRYRPKHTGLPPPGVQMALERNIPREDLSSLEFIHSGTARLDPQIHEQFEQRYGIPILLTYGATEFGGPVTNMTLELRREFGKSKLTSVGRPWAGAQLRIVDPETFEPLPVGQQGLLEVIAPRIGPDWIRTTDLAALDEDGFLYHRGRADGAIVRGGFKIIPELVAEALQTHPAVAAAAVVGLPDARLGQIPVAAVQLKAGAIPPSVAELEAHARRHVYTTHVPAQFRIVSALPRTPSFKVDTAGVLALFTGSPPDAPKSRPGTAT